MIPLIIDCDGVLTDGMVSYPDMGRRFNLRDGHGIQLIAQKTNIFPIIMSGESDDSIMIRAKKLGIPRSLGVKDKYRELLCLIEKDYLNLDNHYIAISDDIPDIELLKNATLAFCPADAHPEILNLIESSDNGMVLKKRGGEGCVRQAIDWMLMSPTWLASLFPTLELRGVQQQG